MFWKTNKEPKKASRTTAPAKKSVGGGDDDFDLSQFGIKPVSDKDVEAEMAKMMAEMSSRKGEAGDLDDSDDETELMRQIQQIGADVPSTAFSSMLSGSASDVDDDGELSDSCLDDPHLQAELQGILGAGKKSASFRGDERVRLQKLAETEKQNAINLKRAGQIQAALEAMRAMRAYEAQIEALDQSVPVQTIPARRSIAMTTATNAPSLVDDDDPDHHNIEVTDDDLNNPEFDAMLHGGNAKTKAAQVVESVDAVTVESVQAKILALKQSAIELKNQNKIPQALTALKEARALEPTLVKLLQRPQQGEALSVEVLAMDSSPSQAKSAAEAILADASADHRAKDIPVAMSDSDDEDMDMDVTDDDLNNPEFDAMLSGEASAKLSSKADAQPPSRSSVAGGAVVLMERHTHHVMEMQVTNCSPEELAARGGGGATETEPSSVGLATTPACTHNLPSSEGDAAPPSGGLVGLDTESAMQADVLAQDGAESRPDSRPRTSSSQLIDEFDDDDEFFDAVVIPPNVSLQDQLNAAKAAAIALKKQGNIQAALIQLRLVKEIEAKLVLETTPAGPTPQELYEQRQRALAYEAIEKQLVDYGNKCRAEATRLVSIDRSRAQGQLDLHKRYVAALETLRAARGNPLQPPPTTHIEEHVDILEHVNVDVPLDRIEISVLQMRSTAVATASKDLFVKLGLNVPSQNPHELTTSTVRGTGSGLYSYNAVGVFPIQRNRGLLKLVELRKAQVEVFTAPGFFSAPQSVGKATVPLSPLLSSSEIQCWLPLMVSRRPCGLDVQIRIRLHVPLRDKEFRPVKSYVFVVDAYPPPLAPAMTTPVQQRPVAAPKTRVNAPANQAPPPDTASIPTASSQHAPPAPSVKPRPADSMSDDDDPHGVDKIVSYDVICEEVAKLEEKIKSGAASAEFTDRLDSLALKKQLLEIDIQTGKLTEAAYVDMLKARIASDMALARSLHQRGRKLDGARVLHRVKVMQQEIASATAPPS
ncbi:hypothetical protein, variant [Aphanomyces invadans]|uniref:C2 domain-containing protein n=1 Tax=Aphanomyces invadans TaxID=157072 RepID=A0A024ULS7_9STRA|nr:hypothetical protein, variant [Aphanomyces invadans]ETW06802.1 hypothetical protein, variant [Aphanomyces invadans]|eukprot:XP_008864877.1 hypothetical protein, variant [Aphanomyces invadans]